MTDISLAQLHQRFASHRHTPIDLPGARQAAVAMPLHLGEAGLEVLFIRRAEYENDPWSGDVAFPGGGIEAQDATPRAAAERETCEEIGLCLQPEQYLGQLDDLAGAYLPVRISCFVYLLAEKPQLQLNHEVVDAFWVAVSELHAPQRNRTACFSYRGQTTCHPIIDLSGYCERFLWGISYRLLQQFFTLLERQTVAQNPK